MAKRGMRGHPEPPRFYSACTLGAADGTDDRPVTHLSGTAGFRAVEFHGIEAYAPGGNGGGPADGEAVLRALLDTDPRDRSSLEGFMGSYGLVRSLARVACNVGECDWHDPIMASCNVMPDPRMTRAAMAHSLGARERAAISQTRNIGVVISDDVKKGIPVPPNVHWYVSALEAQEAAVAARSAVAAILDAKGEGRFPSEDDLDARERLSLACEYASAALARFTPAISPCFDIPPTRAPALAIALAEAVRIALDGEPLKQCKQCGRWFQYQRPGQRGYPVRNPGAPMRRRERGADYCSPECQRAHNHDTLRRRRAAERAAKGGETRGCA